jgi:hypothetical protein
MKTIIASLIGFTLALLSPQIVQAQGTTYMSNLGQASAGSLAVGSDSWLATLFEAGTNSSGYTLNSIQLAMAGASGNPNGFTVMLYNEQGISGEHPGSNLGTLNGSLNPVIGGVFTYTPVSNLTLSPNTVYFIVLTSGTTVANGAYEWDYTSVNSPFWPGGWFGSGAGGFQAFSNGSSWNSLDSDYAQFAIDATPVPEPGILGLLGLGGLAFFCHRRKSKA